MRHRRHRSRGSAEKHARLNSNYRTIFSDLWWPTRTTCHRLGRKSNSLGDNVINGLLMHNSPSASISYASTINRVIASLHQPTTTVLSNKAQQPLLGYRRRDTQRVTAYSIADLHTYCFGRCIVPKTERNMIHHKCTNALQSTNLLVCPLVHSTFSVLEGFVFTHSLIGYWKNHPNVITECYLLEIMWKLVNIGNYSCASHSSAVRCCVLEWPELLRIILSCFAATDTETWSG